MSAPEAPIIEMQGVTKTYRMGQERIHALHDVDMVIQTGEYVAITGTSGSGKSTALQLMGLLDVPTSGVLRVDGQRADRLRDRAQARLRGRAIGFVFQYFHLYPTLDAQRNVELPMNVMDVPVGKRRRRAKELLEVVGLSDRAHHLPNELSGGQRQRIAIARALSNDPPILLADEPTGNLDTATSQDIMALLRRLHGEGRTLIIVTHDTEMAADADRQIVLRDGMVVA